MSDCLTTLLSIFLPDFLTVQLSVLEDCHSSSQYPLSVVEQLLCVLPLLPVRLYSCLTVRLTVWLPAFAWLSDRQPFRQLDCLTV